LQPADASPSSDTVAHNGDAEAGADAEGSDARAVRTTYGMFAPIRILEMIPFAPGSASLPANANAVLRALLEFLANYEDRSGGLHRRIEVRGYADASEGAAARSLSQQRAERTRSALIALGVDRRRLTAVGYGMESPLVPSPDGRKMNPRVSFTFIDEPAP